MVGELNQPADIHPVPEALPRGAAGFFKEVVAKLPVKAGEQPDKVPRVAGCARLRAGRSVPASCAILSGGKLRIDRFNVDAGDHPQLAGERADDVVWSVDHHADDADALLVVGDAHPSDNVLVIIVQDGVEPPTASMSSTMMPISAILVSIFLLPFKIKIKDVPRKKARYVEKTDSIRLCVRVEPSARRSISILFCSPPPRFGSLGVGSN